MAQFRKYQEASREIIFLWPLFDLLPKAYTKNRSYVSFIRILQHVGICKYATHKYDFSALRPYTFVSFLLRGNTLSRQRFPTSFYWSFTRKYTFTCALIPRLFLMFYYSNSAVKCQSGPSEHFSSCRTAAF